jgi:signal transduction histidine kinase
MLRLAAFIVLLGVQAAAGDSPAVTTAQQILDLGADGARRAQLPVRVQGLVTYPDPRANLIYVQDETAGIRVAYTNADYQPESGQRVAVEGTAAGGTFAPFVDCANVRVIGSDSVPEPCAAPASRLAAGELFGQWVQVEGVVRDVAKAIDAATLFVSSGGQRFNAVVQPFPGQDLPADWLDARVILRGVCWTEVNDENQPTGFTLYVPGTNQMFFARAGERDPFRRPYLPATGYSALLRQSDTRVKVDGTVLYQSPGGFLYLQTEGGPLRARVLVPLPRSNPQARYLERPSPTILKPGDRAAVVGAPTPALFVPLLQDAELRRLAEGPAPTPTPATATELLTGKLEGRLVSLRARLLASNSRQIGLLRQQVLACQSGDTLFEAVWEHSGTNALAAWPKNSYLQATGICVAQLGELNQVRSFRILLRDPADLRWLGRPPWWEPVPVGRMLGIVAVLTALATVWIWQLRRQVSQRTAQLRAEVAERQRAQSGLHQALAAERELSDLRNRFVSMVSHEFRTPLGVILTAAENLDSYFERLKPEQRRQQLVHVIQATRHMAKVMENVLLLGRTEAGRLECKPEPTNLDTLCEAIVREVRTATADTNPIELLADRLPQARADAALLRHILGNLLANAVKYSAPGSAVQLNVHVQGENAVFEISDRGIGIPVSDQKQMFQAFQRGRNVGQRPGTGLGLVIVKRCVDLHGGRISCSSQEGTGTRFEVRLPLFAGSAVEPQPTIPA